MKRLFVVLLAVAGLLLVAWRFGRDAGAPPPEASARAEALEGDRFEVTARLVEMDARFDFPEAESRRGVLEAHWRRQPLVYQKRTGDAARFLGSVALRASATEAQWAMALGEKGETWAPDARLWNMNEGSFDQREAFLAPGDGTITLRLDVPRGARLTFAEGTLNATDRATVFVVVVTDVFGVAHEVYRHALEPEAARRWHEADCDLSGFAGQTVQLALHTETAEARAREAGPPVPSSELETSGPGNGRPAVDAGVVVEEALGRPSAPVALWGHPTVMTRAAPRVPYNVLWIVVDALRPDVLASFHDDAEDAAKRAAPYPPLEALLPKVPGLMPSLDALAAQGVRFTHAYSVGSWTRPGTLAMLAGARSSELGIDPTTWMLGPGPAARLYARDPPLLPLALRRRGVTTRAFVNNYFMAGYAPVGIDMGFERVDDHRYRTRDTLEITRSATAWIRANASTRFFAFVNYNSPHEPYEPPAKLVERLPKDEPRDAITRLYMAEAAKDDEAIGALLHALDEAGLREETLIVVTADHGETLSSAHAGTSGLDQMPIRYHHAISNYEETTKVPLLLVLPRVLPAGSEVKARVRTIDIAPTVLDLLGLEPHPRTSGRSLVALARGKVEPEERIVVSEGRGSRAIAIGSWRLIVREGAAKNIVQDGREREAETELFDLESDPGERHDLASTRPDKVAEMRARLDAALENVAVAGAREAEGEPPVVRLRFAGGPSPRRVTATIRVGDRKRLEVVPVELGRETWKVEGGRIDLAFRTNPAVPVGFDIVVDPPAASIAWDLWLDDGPWPERGIFGGPFGLFTPALRQGITNEEARISAHASAFPYVDPIRDLGMFVTREHKGDVEAMAPTSDEGAEEMARLLREWGYARGKK